MLVGWDAEGTHRNRLRIHGRGCLRLWETLTDKEKKNIMTPEGHKLEHGTHTGGKSEVFRRVHVNYIRDHPVSSGRYSFS